MDIYDIQIFAFFVETSSYATGHDPILKHRLKQYFERKKYLVLRDSPANSHRFHTNNEDLG